MLISYNWLKTYFGEKLLPPERLAEVLTLTAFEVESLEKRGDDFILDVKVLPDRACYALSHRGVAKEIAAALPNFKLNLNFKFNLKLGKDVPPVSIKIENPADCRRYIGRRVESVKVGESPKQLRDQLLAIGQRSVNNIVDAANFTMFDMGQPLHAFDADKVKGDITVRRAREGEEITTLDQKLVRLDPSVLVITDSQGPIAIAGIKGGKGVEVTEKTKNLILEAASFNPSLVRRASEKLGLRTDASKRFENNPAGVLAETGMVEFSAMLGGMLPDARFGELVDVYPEPEQIRTITISWSAISAALGVVVSKGEVLAAFDRLGIEAGERGDDLILSIPPDRRDLSMSEDIVEEIGRLIGYDKIPPAFPFKGGSKVGVPKDFYFEFKIRNILASLGFSEVMTPSFVMAGRGLLEIVKPIAADKAFFRESLSANFETALSLNGHNLPLLGSSDIRQFEIGKVFDADGEHLSLAIGCVSGGSAEKVIRETVAGIEAAIGESLGGEMKGGGNIYECNLDKVIGRLSEPAEWDITIKNSAAVRFRPFSAFPFIVRDIAFFVTDGVGKDEVKGVLSRLLAEYSGSLLVSGPRLFDEFKKDERQSFAYRMVFQAIDRTLTDGEVNKIMEKVAAGISEKGWQVR